MNPLEKSIIVEVHQGVHGRVAAGLAQIAREYKVRLYILQNEEEIDCSSVLDVLSMAFVSGTEVKFRVHGKGAAGAITAVEKLLAQRGEP
ncbi:MAG TPA: HPr family phosphocarrier protein [Desulfobacteraceae bacterium]|nr:HPr family phosphocarrier protein [Desulfobacteraceae bacterium]